MKPCIPTGYPQYDAADAFAHEQWGDRVRNVNYRRRGLYSVRVTGEADERMVRVTVADDGTISASEVKP